MLLLFSLIAPTTSLTLFEWFRCTKLADSSWWLSADLTIECPWYAGAPSGTAVLSLVVGLLVYPLGFPLAILRLLAARPATRDLLLADAAGSEPALKPYRFLFAAYQPRVAPWFECAELLRRLTLTGLLSFMGPVDGASEHYTAVRATVAMVLSLLLAMLWRELMPYRSAFLNVLATSAMYLILFVYTMGFFIDVRPWGTMTDGEQAAIGWVLLLFTLPLGAVMAVRLVVEFRKQLKLEAAKRAVPDLDRTNTCARSAHVPYACAYSRPVHVHDPTIPGRSRRR